MIDIRMPNITATTPQGQLEQVRSYLFQMAQQLNFSLREVEKKAETVQSAAEEASAAVPDEVQQAQSTFNSIKSLIIKSADIVNAYYETISTKLYGEYEALSDYGNFKQTTEHAIEANSNSITQTITDVQKVESNLGDMNEILNEIDTRAYIRSGHIGTNKEGKDVYGIAVGQTTTENNVETFNAYAWFTPNKLSFFDATGEVAYISNSTLYITNAVINDSLQVGKYKLESTHGLALVWIGG